MFYGYVWLSAILIFIVLEVLTYQLVCIWFVGGSLAALLAYALGASVNFQIVGFFVVSILLLILTRPVLKKHILSKQEKTNIDSIPGKTGIVIENIDNNYQKGKVKLDGMEWTARSFDNELIDEGKNVQIVEISGIKLIVKEII